MPSQPGTYVLVLHLSEETVLDVGSLGQARFPAGYYLYCGSAQSGLGPRLSRHMCRDKKIRWHIDRLTAVAEPIGALLYAGGKEGECRSSRVLARCPGSQVVMDGFGSSDCSCRAHLYHLPDEMPLSFALDLLRRGP
ncbi:MAG: GIY-YIG nuclease family protein [Methanomassiliicoccales archaeon]|nr:GIY-YIG nuclease family protein [Methanomassiliicoccales archaeon]